MRQQGDADFALLVWNVNNGEEYMPDMNQREYQIVILMWGSFINKYDLESEA